MDNFVKAHSMRNRFKELWEIMVNIENKHADGCTPWRDAETKLVTTKALSLLTDVPETRHNKDYRKKGLDLVNKIINNPDENDWFAMNNLRDEIHNMWNTGCPYALEVERYDEINKRWEEEHPKKWDTDVFYDMTDKSFFTPKNCPTRGDRNNKKESDFGFVGRYQFFAAFIKLNGGSKLASRFWTFVHDIYEDRMHIRMPLDDIVRAQEAYDKGLITAEWLIGFTKRALKHSVKECYFGPETWGKDDDWKLPIYEAHLIRDLLKKRPMEVDCQTMNCDESRSPTGSEIVEMMDGKGIALWWCSKHVGTKPKDVDD